MNKIIAYVAFLICDAVFYRIFFHLAIDAITLKPEHRYTPEKKIRHMATIRAIIALAVLNLVIYYIALEFGI